MSLSNSHWMRMVLALVLIAHLSRASITSRTLAFDKDEMVRETDFPLNFTTFETDHFPNWMQSFLVGNASRGEYTFFGEEDILRGSSPTIYGVTDMVYSLFITGQLDEVIDTPQQKRAWAETILSFRNSTTDFFHYQPLEGVACGYQPYHAAGYATAALNLLGHPLSSATWAEDIVGLGTAEKWNRTFFPWLDPTPEDMPDGKVPPNAFWSTSHAVAAVPSVLTTTTGGGRRHSSLQQQKKDRFFQWWFNWSMSYQDSISGYWALEKKWLPPSKIAMGGSFHLFMIYNYENITWNYRGEVLNSSAAFQGMDGLWDSKLGLTYGIDLDGLFQVLRSAHSESEWATGEAVCKKYLKTAHSILTNPLEVLAYRVDSHLLPGALAAVAECQKWFPHLIVTRYPWVQVIDIVPYV